MENHTTGERKQSKRTNNFGELMPSVECINASFKVTVDQPSDVFM